MTSSSVAPPMLSHDGGLTYVAPCSPGHRYTDAKAYTPPAQPLIFLHIDQEIVVVSKPSFLPSENGRYLKDSVRSRVETELAARDESITGLHLAHRLDWETSGLLVLARTAAAMRSLTSQFRDRTVIKRYIADIIGETGPLNRCGTIDLPLSPDPERLPLQRVDFGNTGRKATTSW